MKTEKKEKIYKAALNMIKKTGVHGLAMGQLSKDSGIAAGTFYHYFSSKDVMLQETFLYCHKRAAAIGAKAIKSNDSDEDRVYALLWHWYEHFTKNAVEIYFIRESESGNSVSKNTIRESRVFYNDVFHFLNQGIEKGVLKQIDPKLMLDSIMGHIFSVIKYEVIFEHSFGEEEIKNILKISWNGLKT